MSSGSVSVFAAASKFMTGAAFWAASGLATNHRGTETQRILINKKRWLCVLCVSVVRVTVIAAAWVKDFIDILLMSVSPRGRARCRRLQHVLLNAPGLDLTEDDLVGIAAVHHVNDLKSRRHLA